MEIMAIFQRLNQESGITLVVVTHDSDIAAFATRNIHFKDGRLVQDVRIDQPRQAQEELDHLPAEVELEQVAS
jgi:putative ABC transport system ATP-binding protein